MIATTLETVLAHTGRLFRIPNGHRRYVVFCVRGAPIVPGQSGRPGGKSGRGCTWSVLDSLRGWREVDTFVQLGRVDNSAEVKARALAAALNDDERRTPA